MTQLGLNPGLTDHWRTLYSLDQWTSYIRNKEHMLYQFSDFPLSAKSSLNINILFILKIDVLPTNRHL